MPSSKFSLLCLRFEPEPLLLESLVPISGGLGEKEFGTEFVEFEDGPSQTVTLQWASYCDAADEAGISRLWGGVHIPADDFAGRIMGSTIGVDAYQFAVINLFEANLVLGDSNCDGVVDFQDISPFIAVLV